MWLMEVGCRCIWSHVVNELRCDCIRTHMVNRGEVCFIWIHVVNGDLLLILSIHPLYIMLQPKLNTVPSTFIVFCKVLGFAIMFQ